MIIGFHHGLGDFIVFSCLYEYIKGYTILCRKDFCFSQFIKCYPDLKFECLLSNPWKSNYYDRKILACNLSIVRRYNNQYIYIPDMRYPSNIPKWKFFCEKLGIKLDKPVFKLFLPIMPRPINKKILFLHNKVPLHHYNSFDGSSFLKKFSNEYYIFDTSKHIYPSILIPLNWLYHADIVIVADSVFYWAALALKKSIYYLHFGRNDKRVYPPDNYKSYILNCNKKF